MAHPVLFGLLAAFIVSRIVFRARMRRRFGGYGRRGWGGGCGRFMRHLHDHHHRHHGRRGDGPIDLGAPDADGDGRFSRGWARGRWQRWGRWQDDSAGAAPVRAPEPPKVDAVAGSLELNQRQREIFEEVVVKAKDKLAAAELAEALSLIAREPFERDAVEFLVGKGELADDLEHLHFSLTPEQRSKLRTVASA